MSAPQLTLVSGSGPSPGGRAILLMQEAKLAAEEQVDAFLATLDQTIRQSREIIDGGEAYPAGVRDLCAKLAAETAYRAQTIRSIMRTRAAVAPGVEPAGFDPGVPEADNPEVGPFPYSPAG